MLKYEKEIMDKVNKALRTGESFVLKPIHPISTKSNIRWSVNHTDRYINYLNKLIGLGLPITYRIVGKEVPDYGIEVNIKKKDGVRIENL